MKCLLLTSALIASCALLEGCISVGPKQLRADEVDYSRALGEAKKRQILATMVGLRYADAPAFLTVSNIIAGYTFTAGGGASLSGTHPGGDAGGLTGTIGYGNSPTFTFTPTTGEGYAAAYIRPLTPTLVLPLADGGVPIDLLLRISLQSIAGLKNVSNLGGPGGDGTPEFFELLRDLRHLQLGGELAVTYKETNKVGRISMVIGATAPIPEAMAEDVAQVKKLLGLSSDAREFAIVVGGTPQANEVTVTMRSVLSILSNLGAEVDVPAERVSDGSTKPTAKLVGGEERPTIVVHSGATAPADAYVAVTYNGAGYWINSDDFDSKYAFTIVQNIMALAEVSDASKAPVITIPAG